MSWRLHPRRVVMGVGSLKAPDWWASAKRRMARKIDPDLKSMLGIGWVGMGQIGAPRARGVQRESASVSFAKIGMVLPCTSCPTSNLSAIPQTQAVMNRVTCTQFALASQHITSPF